MSNTLPPSSACSTTDKCLFSSLKKVYPIQHQCILKSKYIGFYTAWNLGKVSAIYVIPPSPFPCANALLPPPPSSALVSPLVCIRRPSHVVDTPQGPRKYVVAADEARAEAAVATRFLPREMPVEWVTVVGGSGMTMMVMMMGLTPGLSCTASFILVEESAPSVPLAVSSRRCQSCRRSQTIPACSRYACGWGGRGGAWQVSQ